MYQKHHNILQRLLDLEEQSRQNLTAYLPLNHDDLGANKLLFMSLISKLSISDEIADKTEHIDFLKMRSRRIQGVGIYINVNETILQPMPFVTPSFAECADRFYLAPFISNLSFFRDYYFLNLSQNKPSLYRVSLLEIEAISLPDELIGELAAKMGVDEIPNELQGHSSFSVVSGGSKKTAATFHGHSDKANRTKSELLHKFLLRLESEVSNIIGKDYHLILGGVTHLQAEMTRVSKNLRFAEQSLKSNVEDDSIDSIHDKLIDIIHILIQNEVDQKQNNSTRLIEPLTAKYYSKSGEINRLFINHHWLYDVFHNKTAEVVNTEDFIRQVYLKKGEVNCSSKTEPGFVSAQFRYLPNDLLREHG